MYYVYILPCADKKHMKIGYSSTDMKRLITHHKAYNILIKNSRFIMVSDKKLAYKIEQFLLNKMVKLNEIRTDDGYTELRSLSEAKNIKIYIEEIKINPIFTYNESIRMDYKLYKIDDLVDKIKYNPFIKQDNIDKQYNFLKNINNGSVKIKKYKRININGRGWSLSKMVEDK